MNTDTPPPGSPEAVKLGCKCPTGDNGHGKGFGNERPLCDKTDCQLQVVRPGKVECQRCDTWTAQDELDRRKHRADIL